MQNRLREIPSVDEILRREDIRQYISSYSRGFVTHSVRHVLGNMRRDIISGRKVDISKDNIQALINKYIRGMLEPSLKKIVNASGVILHTNLGRAVLSDEAVEAIKVSAAYPVNLELDIEGGKRGDRDSHVEGLICFLTGAEAATVVNNNAAAVLLALNTLGEGKEVIISRGELVEIGGSFRIPEVIQKSGCRLIEVGTTNRTHPADYAAAINPDTAVLLKAHTSNYKVIGFTSSVSLRDLAIIGKQHNIPVVEDLGSGSIMDLSVFGLPGEPVVKDSVEAGADVVTFSGDKLLGGPQSGIIVGRHEFIQRINKNPLKRALRVDKLTIAALEATFRLYLNSDTLKRRLPVLKFLLRPLSDIEIIAKEASGLIRERLGKDYSVEVEDSESQIGSGSLPEEVIPTKVISIVHKKLPPEEIFEMFLKTNPPVLGRVHKGRFLLDMRMIEKAGDLFAGY